MSIWPRVLELVVTDFERSDPASVTAAFHRQAGAGLEGSYSEDAFAIVLRNLIENALSHGRKEEPVDIRLEKGGVVRIVNGAAALSPGELSRSASVSVAARQPLPAPGWAYRSPSGCCSR